MSCRGCSECDGVDHHWLDAVSTDPDDIPCKHCPARGVYCNACAGTGESHTDEPWCEECDGAAVILKPGTEHLQ